MPRKGAFVLTPVGPKPGRYHVSRAPTAGPPVATTAKVKVVKDASPRSKDVIRDIVHSHAGSLKRLADR